MSENKSKEIKFPAKIEEFGSQYAYNKARKQWVKEMYYNGYNLPLPELVEKLDLSQRWFIEHVNPDVPYIRGYFSEEETTGKHGASTCYYDRDQFDKWLMNNSKFTVQTALINLYTNLPFEKASFVENKLNEYTEGCSYVTLARGLPLKHLGIKAKYLLEDIFDILPRDLAFSSKRADEGTDSEGSIIYPSVQSYPFYWFGKDDVIPAKSYKKYMYVKNFNHCNNTKEMALCTSRETFYKEMFERSAVKITLCGGKVYYWPQNDPESYHNIPGKELWILVAADWDKHPQVKEVILEELKKRLRAQ